MRIYIKPSEAAASEQKIAYCARDMENANEDLRRLIRQIQNSGDTYAKITKSMNKLSARIELHQQSVEQLSTVLDQIVALYTKSEDAIAGKAADIGNAAQTNDGNGNTPASGTTAGNGGYQTGSSLADGELLDNSQLSGVDQLLQNGISSNQEKWHQSYSMAENSFSYNAGLLGLGVSGGLLNYATNYGINGGIEYDLKPDGSIDWESLEVKFGRYAEVNGSVAKGEISTSYGLLSEKISGEVLSGELKGEVGLSLIEDGKFAPSIYGEISGKASVLTGEVENSIGTENLNVHRSAEGTLLGAEGELSGFVGVHKVIDSVTGKESVEFGVKGKATAEAYLAEGSVSGGITIFGVDIDVKLTGKAGGAGASLEGGITNNGVSGEIGLGLGLGGGLAVEVDWKNFQLPTWPW